MTGRLLAAVFRQAETLAAGAAPDLTDADLVRRFTRDRDESSFAALVRRHGPVVWGVCRNLLPDEADAEDAFQATFLALVRSAGKVHNPAAVGAWLHGAAVRVCKQAKRGAARRKRREEAAAAPEAAPAAAGPDWAELHAAVHEEVDRLPARERAVFVLCGLGGARQPDAAARLGLKVNTVSGLLARARKRLLDGLARRGLAPAVAAAAAGVGTTAIATVPDVLANSVLSLAAAPAGASAAILELARGATEGAMRGTKQLAAAVVLAGALGVGTGAAVLSNAGAQQPAGGLPGGPAGSSAEAPPAAGGPGEGAGPAGGGKGGPGMPGMSMAGPRGGGMGGGFAIPGIQWEYKTFSRNLGSNLARDTWVQDLAKLGEDGWEVVCVIRSVTFASSQEADELLLKRRKPVSGGMGGAAGMFGAMGGMGGPGMAMSMGTGGPGGMSGMMGGGGGGMAGAGGMPAGMGGSGGKMGMGGPPPGAGAGGGRGPGGRTDRSVVTLHHLRVADLSPELRKQFGITGSDETANTITITGPAKERETHATLLTQLDEAAGKAKRVKE